MKISTLLLTCALALSGTAAYYSIAGLANIFASAFWPVVAMATILEVSKLVVASWLYQKWNLTPLLLKCYLTTAVLVLMFITSLGIFGYLSKAHVDAGLDQTNITLKIEKLDSEIARKTSILSEYQAQLSQLDRAVNIQLDSNKASQAMVTRRQHDTEREDIKNKLDIERKSLQDLSEQKLQLRQTLSIAESKVGPIKYIAEFFANGKDIDSDQVVRWMILLIVLVFDPLAVLMLIAANISLMKEQQGYKPITQQHIDQNENKVVVGQIRYISENNSTVWWNGETWLEIPKLRSTVSVDDNFVFKPEISVTSPPLDIDAIKSAVSVGMDIWLAQALNEPSADQQTTNNVGQSDSTESNQVCSVETNTESKSSQENDLSALDISSNIVQNQVNQHTLEHFKPTHITYGKRI
jgi:hypothetical protein